VAKNTEKHGNSRRVKNFILGAKRGTVEKKTRFARLGSRRNFYKNDGKSRGIQHRKLQCLESS
jgi:hypothetical protein